MSTRTFFRYFPSKDDVLLEAIHVFGDQFLTNLKALLPSLDLWQALGNALEKSVEDCRTSQSDQRDGEMQALIRKTPSLLARQLEAMEKVQVEAVNLCLDESPQASSLTPRMLHAIVGSAFACYHASLSHPAGLDEDVAPGSALQMLIRSLRPVIPGEAVLKNADAGS